MYELADKINFLEKQNKILKKDLRKENYPKGGIVYVINYSDDDGDIYRIGRTNNMKLRKKVYNTHSLHSRKIVLIKETTCPKQFETCLRSMLYQYRYKENKDFYLCSINIIKKAFNICQKNIQCMNRNQKEKIQIQKGGSKTTKKIYRKTIIDTLLLNSYNRKKYLENKITKINGKLY